MAVWQVQQAKTRLSEVIDDAQSKGPQIITRHGAERAVILSMDEYRSLTTRRPDLRDLLLNGPKFGEDLDITRDCDTGREVDFD